MLKVLGEIGGAPASLSKPNAHGAPEAAVRLFLAVVFPLILLSHFLPNRLFQLLLSMATIIGLSNWAIFVIAHLRFRRSAPRPDRSRFPTPGSPWSNCAVLALIFATAVIAADDPGFRLGALLAAATVAGLGAIAAARWARRLQRAGA
jgi:L-asparagine transporter-like permease